MFFWQANKLAFIELGNFYIRSSLVQKRFNKSKVINQVSLVNSSHKNGVVRNKDSFVETVGQIFDLYKQDFSSIVIGLNSPYINYNAFEVSGKLSPEYVADLVPGSKIIHYKQTNNKLATLSVQRLFLSKLYSYIEPLSNKPIRFISINYLKSMQMRKSNKTLILDTGYRSTNISLFDGEFLSFYKTVPLGGESLVLAIAKRYNIPILDSISLIKQTDLSSRDSRDWIECAGIRLNAEQVAETISFYLEALVNKILQTDMGQYKDQDQTCILGWITMIKGSDSILYKYLPSVRIQEEVDQLASHSRLSDDIFAL